MQLTMSASAVCDASGRAQSAEAQVAREVLAQAVAVGVDPPAQVTSLLNGTSDVVGFSLSANPFAALAPNVTASRVLSLSTRRVSYTPDQVNVSQFADGTQPPNASRGTVRRLQAIQLPAQPDGAARGESAQWAVFALPLDRKSVV